ATATSGSPSGSAVTFTMTPTADTVTPTTGANHTTDILITDSHGGSTVADEVEDVEVQLGSGGGTRNVSRDFSATSLAPNTITVNGGTGNDTVDATNLSSANNIVFNGGAGSDSFISSNAGGNDSFSGGADGLVGDIVDYSAVTGGGVNVDLGAGTA